MQISCKRDMRFVHLLLGTKYQDYHINYTADTFKLFLLIYVWNLKSCFPIGRLQLAAILVYFPKQAKITFVIHGDIGSETTKLYMIRYNVYITKQNIER